jgi:predicted nucleotidyltransferase
MRTNLNHLPVAQQDELHRIRDILLTEFARAIASATPPWKKNGKVLKIVLFGSYARDDWVDEPANGYQSDYDLLVIVSHPDLTDIADCWYAAEDLIQRDPGIRRPVNIIVGHPSMSPGTGSSSMIAPAAPWRRRNHSRRPMRTRWREDISLNGVRRLTEPSLLHATKHTKEPSI